jgi:hypothetical protein
LLDFDIFTRDVLDIRPDKPAIFIFGLQPDTGFDLPDIRPDTEY